MEKTPKMGARSKCRSCNHAIVFTGKYWEHEGVTFRHPAQPVAKPEGTR